MSWLAWIVIGLLAGVVAKMVMPETWDEPSGLIGTMLLGIFGAVVGGWVSGLFFGSAAESGMNFGSLFIAFVGSCVVIGFVRLFDRSAQMY